MATLPEHVTPIDKQDEFVFSCHSGVSCFTECCRELELSLSPYDVLRLKQALGITSQQFLEQYSVVEFSEDDLYPKVYLGMVDDQRVSCPFVTRQGCTVYNARPGACRTYPLGRGAYRSSGTLKEVFVLVQEPHCQGFSQKKPYTVQSWHDDQGINKYNRHNDALLPIFNSTFFNKGNRLTQEQAELFILALYNIDQFKETYAEACGIFSDDHSETLPTIVRWLEKRLF